MKINPESDQDRATMKEHRILSLGAQLSALMVASRALTAEAAANFQPALQPAAFHIAQWLHAFGPAKASQVAIAVAMDRSAVSRLTRKLIQAGIIQIRPDPADGRGVMLSVTDRGRNRIGKATKRKGEIFRRRIEAWSEADIVLFTQLLRRFNSATDEEVPQ
jgi:DNA-binding MarR family transcriptional regulator